MGQIKFHWVKWCSNHIISVQLGHGRYNRSIGCSQIFAHFQLDVKNAILHGDLKETMYMTHPPNYLPHISIVCWLCRYLYGLKQAPCAWFEKFWFAILQNGFKRSKWDHLLFLKKSPKGITLLLVYVDDILVFGDDEVGVTTLKKILQASFHIKELGFLGLEASQILVFSFHNITIPRISLK